MIKRILCAMITVLTVCAFFTACGETEESPVICTQHVDKDKNKICENCAANYVGECNDHKDIDDDLFCDYCGEIADMDALQGGGSLDDEFPDVITPEEDAPIIEEDAIILPPAPF